MNRIEYIIEALRLFVFKPVYGDPREQFNTTAEKILQTLSQANKIAAHAIKSLVPQVPSQVDVTYRTKSIRKIIQAAP